MGEPRNANAAGGSNGAKPAPLGIRDDPGAGINELHARYDRLIDSAYASGMLAGWNYCIAGNGVGMNEVRERLVVGHRAAIDDAKKLDRLVAGSSPRPDGGLKPGLAPNNLSNLEEGGV